MLEKTITTVLFDLDGTLLPMDLDAFIHTYFGLLAQKAAPYGYEPKPLMDGLGGYYPKRRRLPQQPALLAGLLPGNGRGGRRAAACIRRVLRQRV